MLAFLKKIRPLFCLILRQIGAMYILLFCSGLIAISTHAQAQETSPIDTIRTEDLIIDSLSTDKAKESGITKDSTIILSADTVSISTSEYAKKRNRVVILKPGRTATKAALWSLIPGGGQVYNKQYGRAAFFGGATLGLTTLAIQQRQRYNRLYDEYISAVNTQLSGTATSADFIQLRDDKRRALRNANLALNGAFFMYGLNILDAFSSFHIAQAPVEHSPLRAAFRSAVVPGWGQAYNRKFWKIPIVYAGLGVTGGFIYFNTFKYRQFRREYLARVRPGYGSTDASLSIYADDAILRIKRDYQRNMEISLIAAFIWYLMNVADATVDAHLYNWNVDDDLSFRVQPFTGNLVSNETIGLQMPVAPPQTLGGLRISLTF